MQSIDHQNLHFCWSDSNKQANKGWGLGSVLKNKQTTNFIPIFIKKTVEISNKIVNFKKWKHDHSQ